MDLRKHLESQLRQLRQDLPRHPWLAARLASLLLATGRRSEALALLRKSVAQDGAYPSGKALLAGLLAEEGRAAEAEALREEICRATPGSHMAWLERLRAAREDAAFHHRLLLQAWSKDLFSFQLNQELARAGLVGGDDYEQALRPTAVEAALREEQFRRLLDLHAGQRPATASPTTEDETSAPATQAPSDAGDDHSGKVEGGPGDDLEAGQPEDEGQGDGEGADADADADAGAGAGAGEDGNGSGVGPSRRNGREPLLREHAERLEGLSRPLHMGMSGVLSAEAARRVRERPRDLFDPRSMMTRRLARIYLEQGYPGLAIRVLEALALREPSADDLAGLLAAARAEEQRLAETPAIRRRR